MGRQLFVYPVFKGSVVAADHYLKHELGCSWSALEELSHKEPASHLNLARFSQPLSTILQVALVELLKSWGIEPVAVIGHSSGEIAAAMFAGAILHGRCPIIEGSYHPKWQTLIPISRVPCLQPVVPKPELSITSL
jgi:acyl transferase domain-containing protein